MRTLINKAGAQLVRRDLTATLCASLVEHLERTGRLRIRPFDAAACPDATLADIAEDKVKWVSAALLVVSGNAAPVMIPRQPRRGPSQPARRRSA